MLVRVVFLVFRLAKTTGTDQSCLRLRSSVPTTLLTHGVKGLPR